MFDKKNFFSSCVCFIVLLLGMLQECFAPPEPQVPPKHFKSKIVTISEKKIKGSKRGVPSKRKKISSLKPDGLQNLMNLSQNLKGSAPDEKKKKELCLKYATDDETIKLMQDPKSASYILYLLKEIKRKRKERMQKAGAGLAGATVAAASLGTVFALAGDESSDTSDSTGGQGGYPGDGPVATPLPAPVPVDPGFSVDPQGPISNKP